MLNFTRFGTPTSRPVLLIVHGLFGSARNWNVIAKRLSNACEVIAVDMRNHGLSDWQSSQSYPDMASDLAEVIETVGYPASVIGHSMGGKAAMVLALQRPELISQLVVADIAPVAYSHTQMGPIEAMRGVDLSQVTRRSDAASQLSVLDTGVRDFLLQSLDVKTGKWRLNLDILDAEMDKIIGFPDVSGQFTGRTLFLSGGASDYVQRDHRSIIKPLFPNAKFAKIPDTGHWLHAEKPREFEQTVRVFLGLDDAS